MAGQKLDGFPRGSWKNQIEKRRSRKNQNEKKGEKKEERREEKT